MFFNFFLKSAWKTSGGGGVSRGPSIADVFYSSEKELGHAFFSLFTVVRPTQIFAFKKKIVTQKAMKAMTHFSKQVLL